MSADSSFAWCSDCGYIGPDFKTEEYLPYVDEGREMPGGKTYECPKCGLTIGEQVIQEHFEPLKMESLEAEVQGLREQLSEQSREYEVSLTMAQDATQREHAEKEVAESRLAKVQGVLEEAPFPDACQFGQFCSCYTLWKKELEAALGVVGEAQRT